MTQCVHVESAAMFLHCAIESPHQCLLWWATFEAVLVNSYVLHPLSWAPWVQLGGVGVDLAAAGGVFIPVVVPGGGQEAWS